jgi:TonB-linked SusC/RagA family outer membrane protein
MSIKKDEHIPSLKGRSFFISYWIFCFLLLNFSIRAQNQQVLIKGNIVDESNNPVYGAMVVGNNTAIGTTTDIDGNFQLSLPQNVSSLKASYLGYTTQTVPVRNQQFFKIILKEDEKMLSEVVVVGYGAQKKGTLTGAISSVQSKSLIQSPTANISNALVGRVPGIVSNQSSGEAGFDATTIRIRGIATLNESGREPLIVIDGIQSSMAAMNALDPHEIESVSILKDASSTAVYGVKGANGVVIVTSKRGQQGKPSIHFSYRFGITKPVSLLKMLNSYDYALYRNEAILSDKDAGKNSYLFTDDELWKFKYNRDYTPEEVEMMGLTDSQKQQLLNSPALYYSSHDYIAEQFDNYAPQHQYNVNVSGGSDKVNYFFSLGNFSQKGNFNTDYRDYSANSNYNRHNLRSNLDIDVHKNLKLSINFGGQFATQTGIVGSNNDGGASNEYARHKAMMVNILTNTPFVGPGIIDNNLVTSYISSKSPLQSKGGYGYSGVAALFNANLLTNNISRLNTNIRLNHLMDYLTRGLSVSGSVSYNDVYRKGVITANNVPTYSVYRNPNNPNELIFTGGGESPKTVTDNQYNYKWNQFYVEGKVDYNRTFGLHDVTGMLVMNAQKTFDPSLEYQVPAGLMGIASRITYKYDNRYLAELNVGYNGSENFPEKKRFGFFPAVSLGWIVTNEKFIPENDFLTWLKIRGSYGEVGNDKVGGKRYLYLPNQWAYLSKASGNGYSFGTTDGSSADPYYAGAYEYFVGNPDVTWERARKTNIGTDINFLKNRLQFVGDFFYEKRNNILWRLGTVPGIVATTLPPANIGEVTNKGYEIQLKWSDHIFQDLYYNIGFNMSYAVNRIDFKDEPSYLHEWMNETGFSLGQYKGYKTSGFYDSEEEASNRPYVSVDGNKVQAGDFRYVDIDGDGKIDANDQVPISYSNLPRYSFGGNFDIEYKGFSLSLLFTGSYKGSMPMTSFYILNPFYMNNGAAFYFQYDNHWTPEKAAQGIESTFPRASFRTYDSQNGAMNDMWIRSTQFLRLKNAEIGYSIKKLGALKQVGISNIRIYLNGNNLLTWGSQLPGGFDPEQEDSGGASFGYLYPPTRTVNFGVSIQY